MWLEPFTCALERDGFRVGYLTLAVHRDRVGLPEKSKLARVCAARGHLRESDGLEHALYERHQIGAGVGRVLDGAREHFLRAACRWNETHTDLHETHVRFSRGLHAVAVKR